MSKRVNPEGPTDADIILIGEAPANEEILRGRPFAGSAGHHLDNFLKMAGLFRGELYITNILKYQAPGNKISRVGPETLRMGELELIEEINNLENPKILVPLGDYPLRAITDKKGIGNFRGSVLKPKESIRQDCIVIPTFHPSIMHYNYDVWPLIVADFIRIRRLKEKDFQFEFPTYNFIIQPRLNQVLETLNMLEEKLHPLTVIDVETPHQLLSAVGIAWSRQDAICIPFYWGNGANYWSFAEELTIWERMAEVLPKLNLAGQNVFFDWEQMHNHGIDLKIPRWDSMLMHSCLYSELRHNLETIVSIYTDIPFYKRDEDEEVKRSTIRAGKERDHWNYNLLDCVSTFWAIEELKKELVEDDMLSVYDDLYAELIEPVYQMNLRGVPVDMERLPEVKADLDNAIKAKETAIFKAAGYEFNIRSHKQVKKLLYEDFGWAPYIDRKTKRPSTNKKSLERLAYKYQSDVPTLISEVKEDYSFLSIFDDENIENGRFRCSYGLARTKTGRLSSKKTYSGKGRNLQNVKRGPTRSFFTAEKGHILIGGDQDQAEARLTAYLSRDEAYIKAADSGRIHFETAKNIFGEEITKDDKRYHVAKSITHGSDYGMGPFTLAHEANISFAEAKICMEKFHEVYPGVRKVYYRYVEECIKKDRTLYNPFGRRQIFIGRINESLFKAGYAFIPQSTSGDLTKKAMKKLYKHFIVLMDQHDGLILSVPEKEAKYGIEALREAYDIPIMIWGIERKIPITVSIGKTWGDMKEIEI